MYKFSTFSLHGSYLTSVTSFKYLGHTTDDALHDDNDINRELKCLFTRVNLLNRRFWLCSIGVKLQLLKPFACVFMTFLWSSFRVGTLNKLVAAYVKCIKIFFGYQKYASVTYMLLLDLGLPSFNTAFFNASVIFNSRPTVSVNRLVRYAVCV